MISSRVANSLSRAVLLAAGFGLRMGNANGLPKPLTDVVGKPLIYYPLVALREAGVQEAFIVIGHKGHLISKFLKHLKIPDIRLNFVRARHFNLGNGGSLAAVTRELVGDSFLLSMADHVFSPELVERVLKSGPISLGVDMLKGGNTPSEDDTKVLVDEMGFVRRIGKRIRMANGIDTGVFNCDGRVLDAAHTLLSRKRVTVSCVMKHLLGKRVKIHAVDVSGLSWLDVDTPHDIPRAVSLLSVITRR